jgi:hypothetical protein
MKGYRCPGGLERVCQKLALVERYQAIKTTLASTTAQNKGRSIMSLESFENRRGDPLEASANLISWSLQIPPSRGGDKNPFYGLENK